MSIYETDDAFSLLMKNLPCIAYSVLVIVADVLYRMLADWLTLQGRKTFFGDK